MKQKIKSIHYTAPANVIATLECGHKRILKTHAQLAMGKGDEMECLTCDDARITKDWPRITNFERNHYCVVVTLSCGHKRKESFVNPSWKIGDEVPCLECELQLAPKAKPPVLCIVCGKNSVSWNTSSKLCLGCFNFGYRVESETEKLLKFDKTHNGEPINDAELIALAALSNFETLAKRNRFQINAQQLAPHLATAKLYAALRERGVLK